MFDYCVGLALKGLNDACLDKSDSRSKNHRQSGKEIGDIFEGIERNSNTKDVKDHNRG